VIAPSAPVLAPKRPARDAPEADAWHRLSVAEVAARLETSPDAGLSSEEAAQRLAAHGPNELEAADVIAPWQILLAQFKNVLILILLVAVGFSAVLGHVTEAVVISVIVVFAAVLGFVQEYRAERAIEALRQMAAPNATVARDGKEDDVPARELVPGDVVLLRAGDRASADARLSDIVALQVEESALTGESLPVEKQTTPLAGEVQQLGDRASMVYAGTTVTYGKGRGITKEAAAMTLTDDNFASIVAAVEQGRSVFGNIKKYLMYLLSANLGEIGLLVGASLLGKPLPLSAVQILYVNLATDGLPALALAVDPPERGLMRRPPRRRGEGIFTKRVTALIVTGGAWSALVTLSLFSWAVSTERVLAEAMTMTFATLVMIEFFKAYSYRSDRNSVFDRPFANRWLNLAIAWEIALVVLVVNVPFLQDAFETTTLSAADWGIVAGSAVTIVPVLEIAKRVIRRGQMKEVTAA
jgi:Ca2+-transporting ATPase